MGSRIDDMKEYLNEEMEVQFMLSCKDIQKLINSNADMIWQEMQAGFAKVFYETTRMQKSGKKGKIKYLIISYLKHSINIDRWNFLLQTYDKTLYLDGVESVSYYYPDYMWQFYKQDMVHFETCLKRKFVRIKPYELEGVGSDYIYHYNSIMLRLIENLLPRILEMDEYQDMCREEELKVVFGDYMDKGILLGKERKDT